MGTTRQPAVAGQFYEADPQRLRAEIHRYLQATPTPKVAPKAVIAPHAGYMYSGPIAAKAYAQLAAGRHVIRRVVLLGPSHFVPFAGLALSSAERFTTPLGAIPVDRDAVAAIMHLPQVRVMDSAHAREHSLEVQLPFLQVVLDDFSLVPLVVGEAGPVEVGEVLEQLWGGPETAIVISSDLSHYHDYGTAQRLDAATSKAIESLRHEAIGYEDACGRYPVGGLLAVARRHRMTASTLDLRNSGDTSGTRDRVVGYGAYALSETDAAT